MWSSIIRSTNPKQSLIKPLSTSFAIHIVRLIVLIQDLWHSQGAEASPLGCSRSICDCSSQFLIVCLLCSSRAAKWRALRLVSFHNQNYWWQLEMELLIFFVYAIAVPMPHFEIRSSERNGRLYLAHAVNGIMSDGFVMPVISSQQAMSSELVSECRSNSEFLYSHFVLIF